MRSPSVRENGPLFAFLAAVLFGGLNYVAVRYSNDGLAPFWGAALRTFAAALIMFAAVVAFRIPLPRGAGLVGAMTFGILSFGGSMALGYWGLQEAPAGLASVLTSLAPLLTIALASAHGLERLDGRRLLGAVVATTGVAIVFADQLGQNVPLVSQLALLASILCFSEATVLLKVLPRSHPAGVNAVGMSAGATFLVFMAAVTGERMEPPPDTTTWIALAWLVVGSVILFSCYLYVLGHWDASAASFMFVLFPIVTVSAGVVLRGELVGPSFILGAALVAVGVYYGAIATRRPAPAMPGAI